MADTIERFVKTLQEDGVNEGRRRAEELTAEARKKAEEIVSTARGEAKQIISDAKDESERTKEQLENELRLATRDALLRLRDAVNASMGSLLRQETSAALEDDTFLGELIQQIIISYAKNDAAGKVSGIVLPDDKKDTLGAWLTKKLADNGNGLSIQGGLRAAGFEYSRSGSKIEVSVDSLVEVLKEQASPRLKELLSSGAET